MVRDCDDSTIDPDNIATIFKAMDNKTQQSTNIYGSKEVGNSAGN